MMYSYFSLSIMRATIRGGFLYCIEDYLYYLDKLREWKNRNNKSVPFFL